jgi:hypothetical protein
VEAKSSAQIAGRNTWSAAFMITVFAIHSGDSGIRRQAIVIGNFRSLEVGKSEVYLQDLGVTTEISAFDVLMSSPIDWLHDRRGVFGQGLAVFHELLGISLLRIFTLSRGWGFFFPLLARSGKIGP